MHLVSLITKKGMPFCLTVNSRFQALTWLVRGNKKLVTVAIEHFLSQFLRCQGPSTELQPGPVHSVDQLPLLINSIVQHRGINTVQFYIHFCYIQWGDGHTEFHPSLDTWKVYIPFTNVMWTKQCYLSLLLWSIMLFSDFVCIWIQLSDELVFYSLLLSKIISSTGESVCLQGLSKRTLRIKALVNWEQPLPSPCHYPGCSLCNNPGEGVRRITNSRDFRRRLAWQRNHSEPRWQWSTVILSSLF